MALNKNIFCVSNPVNMISALWELLSQTSPDFSDNIIFLPSRRAVRSAEKMFVEKMGAGVILPELVPLGTGADDDDMTESGDTDDQISNSCRVIILAKLLTADPLIRTISSALPIAHDLVRMQDYFENEGIDSSDIDWINLVDSKYAAHFQNKAIFLDILTRVLPMQIGNKVTSAQKRNADIRNWILHLGNRKKIIVCGSTASVPATSDLMEYIAGLDNGYIILPGKISGASDDFSLDTNPYNAQYKFLNKINISASDIKIIDTGKSDIDFYNNAFGNTGKHIEISRMPHLIECARESEEANVVAEIAKRAIDKNQTVLVITPDSAANQRIEVALRARSISGDFSGGKSGKMTLAGRAILNFFDDIPPSQNNNIFDDVYHKNNKNLIKSIIYIVDNMRETLSPEFDIDSDESAIVWDGLSKLSEILMTHGIVVNAADARALISDALGDISIRPPLALDPRVVVLGTIESRMQTADIVILTGLNEGMFPAMGYSNAWLPRPLAMALGLPSPSRKVSLMALDFINLSCAQNVYWLRSRSAGGSQTTTSRFLSRVRASARMSDKLDTHDVLLAVRAGDDVPPQPLDYSPPAVPADWSDVYATELEKLIHNPYVFYASHILRLKKKDDYWAPADARDFGNLVHGVIEIADGMSAQQIIMEMDLRAKKILPLGSVILHFWHKRFCDMAPHIKQILDATQGAMSEVRGSILINGRTVRAIADRITNKIVLDIKTGSAPSKKQMMLGNMPQLGLIGKILEADGFPISLDNKAQTPVLQFLQLNDIKLIEYQGDNARAIIDAATQKVSELFGQYCRDGAPYEYRETTGDKYKMYDDLARVDD